MPSDTTLSGITSVNMGLMVARSPELLPQTASKNLFLSTGHVLLTGFWGIVTAAIDATADLLTPFIGVLGATNIGAQSGSVASLPIGAYVFITGVFATVLTITATKIPTSFATMHGIMINKVMWPGGLNLGIAASGSNVVGQVQWVCTYIPMQPGAAVLAA